MSDRSDIAESVTSAFSTNKEGVQRLLTIPRKLIFDEMLRHLGLPLAQYHHTIYEDCKFCVTVVFKKSKLSSQDAKVPIPHENIWSCSMDEALAKHNAIMAAVKGN